MDNTTPTPATAESSPIPTGRVARPGSTASRVRDLIVDIAPALSYTVSYTATNSVGVAVGVAVTAAVVVLIIRLVGRRPRWRTLASLAVVAIGAASAGRSGAAEAFFLPQMGVHAGIFVVMVVLALAGLPPAGVIACFVTGEGFAWRRCRVRRQAYALASLAMIASPVVVAAANIPLYLAGNVVALGIVDLFTPMVFATAAVICWRIYRRATRGHVCTVPAT